MHFPEIIKAIVYLSPQYPCASVPRDPRPNACPSNVAAAGCLFIKLHPLSTIPECDPLPLFED